MIESKVECPFCGLTEYVVERDCRIRIVDGYGNERYCLYFCIKCRRDFSSEEVVEALLNKECYYWK